MVFRWCIWECRERHRFCKEATQIRNSKAVWFQSGNVLSPSFIKWVYQSYLPKNLYKSNYTIRTRDLCLPAVSSVQFISGAQSCPTLCDPINHSMPGLPVNHQLPEFTQTHVHRVSDAIQPSHPRSSPSPPAHSPSKHQCLFQWVNSSHEVAKVLEFQL